MNRRDFLRMARGTAGRAVLVGRLLVLVAAPEGRRLAMGLALEGLQAVLKQLDQGPQFSVLGWKPPDFGLEFLYAGVSRVCGQRQLPSASTHVTGWEYKGPHRRAQV